MKRKLLIQELDKMLQPDETFLFYKMLDTKLTIKCGSNIGSFFDTDTGGPQGDCSSAKNFTFYLAESLKEEQSLVVTPTNQDATNQNKITIEPQYADDITKISTEREEIVKTLNEYPAKLKKMGSH